MAKCRYCYLEENGDIPDDRISLILKRNVGLPIIGEFLINDRTTNVKSKMHVSFEAQIYKEKEDYVLGFGGWDEDDSKPYFVHTTKKINYCPMCGRKLIDTPTT